MGVEDVKCNVGGLKECVILRLKEGVKCRTEAHHFTSRLTKENTTFHGFRYLHFYFLVVILIFEVCYLLSTCYLVIFLVSYPCEEY